MLVGVGRPAKTAAVTVAKLSPCSWGWAAVNGGTNGLDVCCPHARGGGPGAHPPFSGGIQVVPMLVGVGRLQAGHRQHSA